jgi:Xaa-Pro dipeptidase
VTDLLTELRLEKSPAEIAYMRKAGQLYDLGVNAALATIGVGKLECQVHAAIVHALYENGGEFMSVSPTLESGPRTLYQTHGAALRREMKSGDPVTSEIGACYRRYHCVAMRSIAIVKPSPAQQTLHAIINEAVSAGLEVIGPGVAVAEVAATMNRVYSAHGIDRSSRHSGYGIGVGYPPTWLDNLRIKVTDEHILKPGMTFILHGVLADQEAAVGVALGDPVMVTENGVERLIQTSRELFVCN